MMNKAYFEGLFPPPEVCVLKSNVFYVCISQWENVMFSYFSFLMGFVWWLENIQSHTPLGCVHAVDLGKLADWTSFGVHS